jgi:ubiquinone/menaquinone biosynthesis C-methylase UbiE
MNKIQVSKEHYYKGYDSLSRFISYYYQCKTVLDLNPSTVLEIGIGNKTVSNYLKEAGVKVTTCDFDKELNPDVVADIRDLSHFKDNSFDVVVAFEILEHLPWEEVDKALKELKRVSKKYVVISVPWTGWFFNMSLDLPFNKKLLGERYLNIGFLISRFFANMKPRKEHFWEIGFKNYPLSKIKAKFKLYLNIEKEYQIKSNRYHHFFILSK